MSVMMEFQHVGYIGLTSTTKTLEWTWVVLTTMCEQHGLIAGASTSLLIGPGMHASKCGNITMLWRGVKMIKRMHIHIVSHMCLIRSTMCTRYGDERICSTLQSHCCEEERFTADILMNEWGQKKSMVQLRDSWTVRHAWIFGRRRVA